MPSAASFLRVVRVWQRRASALRRCVYSSSAAAASRISLAALLPSPQERTSAAVAVRTWQTVNSGFFPPQFLLRFGEEQMAHGRERLVSFETQIRSSLEVIEPQFGL